MMVEKLLKDGVISVNQARKLYGLPEIPEEIHPIWVRSCPNCGAPVKGEVCEYCDSVFSHTPVESIVKIQSKIDEWSFQKNMDSLYEGCIQAMCRRF